MYGISEEIIIEVIEPLKESPELIALTVIGSLALYFMFKLAKEVIRRLGDSKER